MEKRRDKKNSMRIIHGPPYLEGGFRVYPYINELGEEVGSLSVRQVDPEIQAKMPRTEPRKRHLLRRIISHLGENLGIRE